MRLRRAGMIKHVIALGVLAVLAPVSKSQAQVPASAPVEVTIGVASPATIFSLIQIASDQHLWPAGVHVTWTTMSPTTIVSSLVTGRVQLVLGAPPQYDIGAYNAKVPIQWIAQWQDPADFQMVVRPGISSVADLKGKVIASTAIGSSTALLAEIALQKAGLQSSDYKILPMGDIGSAISAFAAGSASSLVSTASAVAQLVSRIPGAKVAYDFYDEKIPWIGAGVVAYQPWVTKNETATIAILSALNKALNLVHNEPALVEPSISKFVGAQSPAAAAVQLRYLENRTPGSLGPVSLRTLQSIYAAVRTANNGAGPSDAFARSAVDNRYVEKMLAASR